MFNILSFGRCATLVLMFMATGVGNAVATPLNATIRIYLAEPCFSVLEPTRSEGQILQLGQHISDPIQLSYYLRVFGNEIRSGGIYDIDI